jgi:hypothetical protein
MDNFKLNPAVSTKSQPNNFGLSNKFEELDVLAEEPRTIESPFRGVVLGSTNKFRWLTPALN